MKCTPQIVEVWGDLACFSRPELKVERFSYPVITPSAARAVLEAIYRRPRFRWQVTRIEVLKPPRYIALRRNEMKEKAPSPDVITRWMEGRAEPEPLFADAADEGNDRKGRTQRQTLALKDVHYRLHAEIRPWSRETADLVSFERQFARHLRQGQCLYQPYLGCREFPAYFGPPTERAPVELDQELGWMLYDVFDLSRPSSREAPAPVAVSLFPARLVRGVLTVPEFDSPEVCRSRGGATNA